MIKALIKKQLTEIFSFFWHDRKKKSALKGGKLAGTVILYIVLFGFIAVMFGSLSFGMCIAFVPAGLDWMYFSVNVLLAALLGIFGSAFNANSSLYQAKDNDMLLSMPIKPRTLLFVRLIGVYAMGLLYEMLVMLPALAIYFIFGNPSLIAVIFSIIATLAISFFVLALSAVIGWIVAFISKKTKNKSFVAVAVSLIFFGAYYYFFSQSSTLIEQFFAQASAVGSYIQTNLYPLYIIGSAFTGNVLSFLIVFGIIAAVFCLVYLVLTKSYIKIVTSNKGEKKKKYKAQAVKAGNADSALFRKELKRFTKSSTYMLNCGLGIVLMIVAAVALFINKDFVTQLAAIFSEADGFVALLACGLLCMIASMNDISAPSVSLEGKNIWIAQSLPVSSWQILRAKMNLHIVLTIPPLAILIASVEFLIGPAAVYAVLIPIICILFVILSAELGLVINLKSPNLEWTNEVVPIKQSMGVIFALFGGWAVVLALGALYVAVMSFITPLVYMIFVAVLFAAGCVVTKMWLKNKGAKIFESL